MAKCEPSLSLEARMLTSVWAFLKHDKSRAALGVIGSSIVLTVGACWAVVTFFYGNAQHATVITVDNGSVVIGRDIVGTVNIGLNEERTQRAIVDAQRPLTEKLAMIEAQFARVNDVSTTPSNVFLEHDLSLPLFGSLATRSADNPLLSSVKVEWPPSDGSSSSLFGSLLARSTDIPLLSSAKLDLTVSGSSPPLGSIVIWPANILPSPQAQFELSANNGSSPSLFGSLTTRSPDIPMLLPTKLELSMTDNASPPLLGLFATRSSEIPPFAGTK